MPGVCARWAPEWRPPIKRARTLGGTNWARRVEHKRPDMRQCQRWFGADHSCFDSREPQAIKAARSRPPNAVRNGGSMCATHHTCDALSSRDASTRGLR